MINFGTVGTGSIVATFAAACGISGGARISAVYSRSMDTGRAFAAANAAQAAVYDDLAAMLAQPGLDAVYIASPNSLHYPQARQCLEAGKHVLCEKPVTVTPCELEELQTLAARRGLVFMEAVMSLCQPHLPLVREAIERCGRVRQAHICYSQLSSKYPALLAGGLPNIFNPRFATGALMDIGVYCVNAAVLLFGEPEEVYARASFLETGADGSGCAVFTYPDKLVTLEYSKVGQDAFASQIVGDKGTVTIDLISMLTGVGFTPPKGAREDVCGALSHAQAMAVEVDAFARFIEAMPRGSEEYGRFSRHAMAVSRVMEKMRRSAGIEFAL